MHIVQFLSSSVFHHSRTRLDILITSAIVKIILASDDSTSGVGTLRVGLDPISQIRTLQTTQSRCSTCWSHPHLGNSLPHLRLRQLSFSSAAIRHDVFHHLPFDSSSPRESSGSRTPATPPVSCLARHFTLFTRSFTCCVRTGCSGGSGSTALLSHRPRVACGGR